MINSPSASGLSDSNLNPTAVDRQNTYESLDISLSSRQTNPSLGDTLDLQSDNNASISDDPQQYDRTSQYADSTYDERRSISSSEKTRRQMISTKLFKPFQNIRFRKKNANS
jgi:hypothetical protein